MAQCDFADLAHRILVQERTADRSIEMVAKRMGLGYDALYARLVQRTPFRPAEASALIAATGDIRLAQQMLAGTEFLAAERPGPMAQARPAALIELTLDHVEHAIAVLVGMRAALADNRIDHRDRALLLGKIAQAESLLATLRVSVEAS